MPAEESGPQFGIPNKIRSTHQTVPCPFPNDRQICGWTDNHRFPGFDDSCFLDSDGVQRVPQKLLMVHSDARDYRNFLFHNVRRVEPAAKTHLENREFHAIAKIEKCHCRYHFKIRWWIEQILGGRGGAFDGAEDFVQIVI